MEKDEHVYWADIQAQLQEPGHTKSRPIHRCDEIAKVRPTPEHI